MPDKFLNIGGLKVKVGTPEECEQVTAVVCGPASYFPDDVWTTCAVCGTEICHRPYVPVTPPKLCIGCAFAGRS